MANPLYQKQTKEQKRRANGRALLLSYKQNRFTLSEYVRLCEEKGLEVLVNVEHEKRYNT